jgi:hypothetical protein
MRNASSSRNLREIKIRNKKWKMFYAFRTDAQQKQNTLSRALSIFDTKTQATT